MKKKEPIKGITFLGQMTEVKTGQFPAQGHHQALFSAENQLNVNQLSMLNELNIRLEELNDLLKVPTS